MRAFIRRCTPDHKAGKCGYDNYKPKAKAPAKFLAYSVGGGNAYNSGYSKAHNDIADCFCAIAFTDNVGGKKHSNTKIRAMRQAAYETGYIHGDHRIG